MKKKKTVLIILIVLAAALLSGFILFVRNSERFVTVSGAGSSEHAQRPVSELRYYGSSYKLRRNIDTVLIIGTDNYDNSDSGVFYNYEQADFFVILVLDNKEQTVSAIQLNRDTMCDVQWLDVLGKVGGTKYQHLALSHTYGSGREDSCENVVDTVEMLCFNAPIDHYLAFTMSAVPIVNDMVGGVTVTCRYDMTKTDPAFTEGTTLTLMGEKALKFARARMELGDEDNEARLDRHRSYLEGFIVSAKEAAERDSTLAVKMLEACGDNLCTDMDATKLSELAEKLKTYEYLGMKTPEGYDKQGEKFNEFYVDESSLWKIVKQAYCG